MKKNGWNEITSTKLLRRLPALLLALLFVVCLLCDGGGSWLRGRLGFRAHKYDREKPLYSLSLSGATATDIQKILSYLSVNDGIIQPIRTPIDAVKQNKDAILCAMFAERTEYYMGNAALLADVEKKYPGKDYTVFIPAADFARTVYANFGGRYAVKHAGTSLWKYLPAAKGYTTLYSLSLQNETKITLSSLWRGERALHATVLCGGREYTAVFIPREDGSFYLEYLI